MANREISAVWVASAEDALHQLAFSMPKAVVLDLLLPGAQGEDFLRSLHREPRWDLPVLVVTVKDLSQSERTALSDLNVLTILRKEPNVGSTVADVLESCIRSRSEVAA